MLAETFTLDIGANALAMFTALFALIGQIALLVLTNKRTKELKPNGGSSMHDMVSKLYRTYVADERADDATSNETNRGNQHE